jgi:hypothetical protein
MIFRVHSGDHTLSTAGDLPRAAVARRRRGLGALTGGGPDGNEQLTAITGVILIALLFVIGITILRMRQLISVHLFVGLLLIGPVALKMASTGYRFMRYYTGDRVYREKGPPETALRMIAPIVVATTVLVFVTGVLLLFAGPAHRNPLLELHKVGFIVWVVFTALHVLGHLPGFGGILRAGTRRPTLPGATLGSTGRWIALVGALVGGLVLALVLVPDFHVWTARGAFPHHHHDG